MSADRIRTLVAEATLAPSVHNIQPARWRIDADGVTLIDFTRRRLPAADPHGHDASMSLGAAAEGLRLAASRAGLRAVAGPTTRESDGSHLRLVTCFRFEENGARDPLVDVVERRQSWRGKFRKPTEADRCAAQALAAEDATVLVTPDLLRQTARALDTASWRFMSHTPFRRELLSWMRLSRSDTRWTRDGLNAEAMAMSGVEAFGAGIVLGFAFSFLKRIGLAKPLLAETAKTESATAIVLFHRPIGEDPFISGGHFYRLWLRIEAAGFGAAVLAALADDAEASAWLAQSAGLPSGHRLVSAFRIGRRPDAAGYASARLPLDESIVS